MADEGKPDFASIDEPEEKPRHRRSAGVAKGVWKFLLGEDDQESELNQTERHKRETEELGPRRRQKRAGVITILWRFLFGSDDEPQNSQGLVLAQYLFQMRLAAIANDVKKMQKQEDVSRQFQPRGQWITRNGDWTSIILREYA